MSRLSSHISLNKRQSRLLSSAVRHLRWASSTNLPPLPSQSTSNYFELFDLSASKFSVDRSKLKKKFLNWQRRVHPDTFAAAADGAEVEAKAKAWSELINHAYKTLDSDLDRALYMASLIFHWAAAAQAE